MLTIVLGVIVLLGLIAVVASRGGDDDGDNGDGGDEGVEQTRPVTVEGAPLARHEPDGAGDDAAIGAVAPELDGARFDGTALQIGADGQPKVLVFLAHWCPHCQREVPVLADWLEENGAPDDVDLYAVATSTSSDRPNYPPSEWLEREGFSVPALADDVDSSAAEAFGLAAFPYFVALDGDNRVVERASGELTVEQWEALVDRARS